VEGARAPSIPIPAAPAAAPPARPLGEEGEKGGGFPSLPLEALSALRPADGASLQGARFLGQLEECFLLFEHPRGLLVVDQHAAHERVLYERFREGVTRGEVERQGFLLPPLVELPSGQALRAEEGLGLLARAGFEVEPFGPGAFRLLAAPPLFAPGEPERLLLDLLDLAGEEGSPLELADSLLARAACRAAVKGGAPLRREEAEALLSQLGDNPRRWSCPHGRPVAMVLESGALRRGFLR
ncbi:MAG: DNA mismatch repair protein MutL, partial [Nitrospinota bacterium]